MEVYAHSHALKHGLFEAMVPVAWANFVRSQPREALNEDECLRVGYGRKTPTPIQMVGVVKPFGVLIIHAMTPPQDSVLEELGMMRRRI